MRALLGALWQSDTAFPSGGFAFSNGVEAAVVTLGVLDRAALTSLIGATLVRRWANAERPATLYAFHAESLRRLGAGRTRPNAFHQGNRQSHRQTATRSHHGGLERAMQFLALPRHNYSRALIEHLGHLNA